MTFFGIVSDPPFLPFSAQLSDNLKGTTSLVDGRRHDQRGGEETRELADLRWNPQTFNPS